MNDPWAILLRPVIVFAVFLVAALITRPLYRHLPAGRLRDTLFARTEIVAESLPSIRVQWVLRAGIATFVVLCVMRAFR